VAQAGEHEWVLRVQHEAKNLSITLGQTTLYGNGGARLKGSGQAVERARAVAPFSRVRLDGPVDVRLVQAGQEAVKVSADDNLEPLITTAVDGDTLVVGVKPGSSFSTRHPLRVTVDFKQLTALEVRGSGDASVDRWKGDRLRVEMSGSGDVAIGLLEAREWSASLSGSGDLSVSGQADQQDWVLSGSGDVSASSLSGQQARAQLSGSGDLRLGVSQDLDAKLSGSGDLRYAGRPKVKSQVTGSGELMAR
jgi:hypothetical protein